MSHLLAHDKHENKFLRYLPILILNSDNLFLTGSVVTDKQIYPVSPIAFCSCSALTSVSDKKDASPFDFDAVTFFASGTFFRITSQICDSHIPHIIPSIFKIVFIIFKPSFLRKYYIHRNQNGTAQTVPFFI